MTLEWVLKDMQECSGKMRKVVGQPVPRPGDKLLLPEQKWWWVSQDKQSGPSVYKGGKSGWRELPVTEDKCGEA